MDYSAIAKPLAQLMKKGQIWNWNKECQEAFDSLISSFVKGLILANYHADKVKQIEIDACDLAEGAVLSQLELDRR